MHILRKQEGLMELDVLALSDHSAVQLAKSELLQCLSLACGEEVRSTGASTLTLAVEAAANNGASDGYHIDVEWVGHSNRVTGTNPRSVLFGVYALLRALGFRWIRPGKDGELVPCLKAAALRPVHMAEQAGYPFRGICIEGAVSRENVLDTVEWMSRHGMNAYFIQFRDAFTFFDRWYSHADNPLLEKERFDAEAITQTVRQEVKRRGMELQMVGHGWTCEPFGIQGKGWYVHKDPVPPSVTKFFAEVNGKRELWGGIALNTSLCYGNPEVRAIMTDAIVKYAQENPDVDVIHFWLADGTNNNCECSLCAQKRPSDWYVDMLNELDEKLTKANLPVRIVFLVYVDLLWQPLQSRLKPSSRFILMFAPITRTYSKPFLPEQPWKTPLPDYVRNRLTMPTDPAENLAFLEKWFEQFDGPSFDFDYHFMWAHQTDPGYYHIAKILQQDCSNLANLHMQGMISCQNQRVFFPNGLGMNAMARTLWNPKLSFEQVAQDFFRDAYGLDAYDAQVYFEGTSNLFQIALLRGEKPLAERQQAAKTLQKDFEALVAAVQPALTAGRASVVSCWKESWEQLALHIERNRLLAQLLVTLWTQGKQAAIPKAELLYQWAQAHERRLQSCFDVFEYISTIRREIMNAPGLLE